MSKKTRVGIVGAGGIAAGKLIGLLLEHESVELTYLVSETYIDKSISLAHPQLKNLDDFVCKTFDLNAIEKHCDIVFLARAHGHAMKAIPEIIKRGIKVIDLSADFRIKDPEVFYQWYQTRHTAPEFLSEAVYGLPELYYERIKAAKLVANPGCYPTSIILGVAPLLNRSLFDLARPIIVHAVSGISGAGRGGTSEQNQFISVDSNIRPYNIGLHRHTPEIEQELSTLSKGKKPTVFFAPHVGPFHYGIASNLYIELNDGSITEQELFTMYQRFYENSPFVRIYEPGSIPQIKDSVHTNFCDIGLCRDVRSNLCVVFSVLDNIIKGAAGQAVQNMNIMLGFDEMEGLPYGHTLRERIRLKKKAPLR